MTLDEKLSSTMLTVRISNSQGKFKTNFSSTRRESSELQKSVINLELEEAGHERIAVTPAKKKKKKETSNSTLSSPATSRKKKDEPRTSSTTAGRKKKDDSKISSTSNKAIKKK